MSVQLTKSDLDAMAESAGDVEVAVKKAKRHVDDTSTPDMPGFQTKDAIAEVTDLFADKADKSAARWEHFGAALEETGANITGTDEANKFHFDDSVGDKD